MTAIEVKRYAVYLCDLCVGGAGGECHTPGCTLWCKRAPDVPLRGPMCVPLATPEQLLAQHEATRCVRCHELECVCGGPVTIREIAKKLRLHDSYGQECVLRGKEITIAAEGLERTFDLAEMELLREIASELTVNGASSWESSKRCLACGEYSELQPHSQDCAFAKWRTLAAARGEKTR